MPSNDATDNRHVINIDDTLAGMRLDKGLSTALPDTTRSHLKYLITQGAVSINDRVVSNPAHKLQTGYVITITDDGEDAHDTAPAPEAITLDIRYEDEALLVINKPAGLVVHPGAGHYSGTLVNALLYYCGDDQLSSIGGSERAGIVHRLDKDTSGLMLIAKNNVVHERLARAIRQRRITRVYESFVLGCPLPPAGTIDTAFARHPRQRTKYYIPREEDETTRHAITHYKQLASSPCGTIAHIQCRLETGRTHQIRVHMAYKGTPVLGDPVYGPTRQALASALQKSHFNEAIVQHIRSLKRQALHAGRLSFEHPVHKTQMSFKSDLPADMACLGML